MQDETTQSGSVLRRFEIEEIPAAKRLKRKQELMAMFIEDDFFNKEISSANHPYTKIIEGYSFILENKYNLAFISHVQDTLLISKEKKIVELETKLKNEENQLINDNKIYYLELAELQEQKNKLKSELNNYELNETKKKIIELESKIEHYKPKTNLMIAEYKKQLEKIKTNEMGCITYFGQIIYIKIENKKKPE